MNRKTFYILFTFIFLILVLAFSKAQAATLTLSPASDTVTVGQNINVDVMLDSQGVAIDGVDINSLRYNRTILEVQDADLTMAGVQITAGTLLSQTLTNTVNATNGTIDFSQVTIGGVTYTGSGKLATITFKGLVSGTSAVTFDFTLGNTSDTNVAGGGVDRLTSVGNGSFTVTNAITPSPSPTPTPAPSGGGGGGGGGSYSSVPSTPVSTGLLLPPNFNSLTPQQKTIILTAKITELRTLINSLLNQSGQSSATTPATLTTKPSLTRTVYIGSRGVDITALQNFLISKGYLTLGNNTGYFGPLTRTAVQKYQCDKMQICSGDESSTGYGLVGQRTRVSMSQ